MHNDKIIATLCNYPPERDCTFKSNKSYKFNGFVTSEANFGWSHNYFSLSYNNYLTVPPNFGWIYCGFTETSKVGKSPLASLSLPANILINVVLPVPFYPSITTICELLKYPCSTSS